MTGLGRGAVVLGMHRSGTSVLTECLVAGGLSAGPDHALLPPAIDNPRGFFELLEVVAANNRILELVGARWDLPVHDPADLADPEFDPVREAVGAVLDEHLPTEGWVLKDPRLCVMWPFYAALFPVPPVVVFMARSPTSAADSLHTRDLVDRRLALDLWEVSNRHALAIAAAAPHAVHVRYEALLEDPVGQLARVGDVLTAAGLDFDVSRAPVEQIIDPSLQRSRMVEEDPTTSVGRLWEEIVRRSDDEDPADLVGTASPRRRTIRIAASYHRLVHPGTDGDRHDVAPEAADGAFTRWMRAATSARGVAVARHPQWLWGQVGRLLHNLDGWHATVAVAADGSWSVAERSEAARRLVEGIRDVSGRSLITAYDRAQPYPAAWTSGLVADLVDAVLAAPDLGIELACALPGGPQDQVAPEIVAWAQHALAVLAGSATQDRGEVVDAGAVAGAVLDGSIRDLVSLARERPAVVVGPGRLDGLAVSWGVPHLVHVPVAEGPALVAQRTEIVPLLATLAGQVPDDAIFLVAADPIGPLVVGAVRAASPSATILDVGDVLDVWVEPDPERHAWFLDRVDELPAGIPGLS